MDGPAFVVRTVVRLPLGLHRDRLRVGPHSGPYTVSDMVTLRVNHGTRRPLHLIRLAASGFSSLSRFSSIP